MFPETFRRTPADSQEGLMMEQSAAVMNEKQQVDTSQGVQYIDTTAIASIRANIERRRASLPDFAV